MRRARHIRPPCIAVTLDILTPERPVLLTGLPTGGYLITVRAGLTAGEVERAVLRMLENEQFEELLAALGIDDPDTFTPWWDRGALVTRETIRQHEREGRLIPWPFE